MIIDLRKLANNVTIIEDLRNIVPIIVGIVGKNEHSLSKSRIRTT